MDLTQKSQALVAIRRQVDQKPLGWCTMRPAGGGSGCGPKHRERHMHVAVQKTIGSDNVIGCIVIRNTKPSTLKEFCVDTLWVVGPELKPLELHVRSVGSTSGSGSQTQPLLQWPTSIDQVVNALRSSYSQAAENLDRTVRDTLASISKSATTSERTTQLKMEQRRFVVSKLHALEEHRRVPQQRQQHEHQQPQQQQQRRRPGIQDEQRRRSRSPPAREQRAARDQPEPEP